MILVYVRSFSNPKKGLTGVTAEKWPELLRDMSGQIRPHVAKYEIHPKAEQFTIAGLVALYPPPVVAEST